MDQLRYEDAIGLRPDVYESELMRVNMSRLQFEKICNFLFLIVQLISKYALKNIALGHKVNRRIQTELEIMNLNRELEQRISKEPPNLKKK
ncbi:hypothetical protein [Desulfosporosinus lacus]|uniref:Uncharacterized protein n=1 Tax=Desulfosporosinus lacus DSM 15449 TaxID=1121420 RepID=A0A1M6F2Y1_9FIRM|nr:hypothetical protein [Desulfosporosinus lacus]SHI92030.1 hypothetical protein SAMN02746098_04866 [Desulfosporosinus lacus DSM 15449]